MSIVFEIKSNLQKSSSADGLKNTHVQVLHFARGAETNSGIVLRSIFPLADRSSRILRDLSRRHLLHVGDLAGMTARQIFGASQLSLEKKRNFFNVVARYGLILGSEKPSEPMVFFRREIPLPTSRKPILTLVKT